MQFKMSSLLKKILYLFILLFLNSQLQGQSCPPNGLLIESQQVLDSFKIKYPNCTEIKGLLIVGGSKITSLKALSNLKKVGGLIIDATFIENFEGLEKLEIIDGDFLVRINFFLTGFEHLKSLKIINGNFKISDNHWTLKTLQGVDSLKSIKGSLDISSNNSLKGIKNFIPLATVDTSILIYSNQALLEINQMVNNTRVKILWLRGNSSLKSFTAFNTIEQIDELLHIERDDSLVDLSDLKGLKRISKNISIKNNYKLESLKGLDSVSIIGSDVLIEKNTSLRSFGGLQNITYIGGNITLEGNDSLSNFDGLENLNNVFGRFWSINNKNLQNIKGLKNLTYCHHFYLAGSRKLFSLEGLDDLIDIGAGGFSLYGVNPKNLNALKNLRAINGAGISITSCDSLLNLNGLDSLKLCNGIFLNSNKRLRDILSIRNISTDNIKEIVIEGCDSLTVCEIENICSYLSAKGVADISTNGTGCSSTKEVLNKCNPLGIGMGFSNKTLNIYPNPTEGLLVIDDEELENAIVTVFDVMGKPIKTTTVKYSIIDITGLESGLYFISLSIKDKFFTSRVIKK